MMMIIIIIISSSSSITNVCDLPQIVLETRGPLCSGT